jgi:ATP-dependent helicase HrpA
VIEVSGRLYPIEMRWRPPADNVDLPDAIVDAVDECHRNGPGDVLVFLPGEREIREAAEALRKHHPPGTELLPLYARQSAQEQQRVFAPAKGRRVVLATNVAETSLTVPGIRYVVDSGLARVKRYSHRNKVEMLQVEDIARSAANQRAGRCGRVMSGVCIRLYGEDDFTKAPRPHRARAAALLAGRRHPAHEVAAPGRGGGIPLPRQAAAAHGHRRLPAAGGAGRGGRRDAN